MAEQIISPGVFTRENDLSFLPQGIGAIGAAIIGPTEEGPAFVPTVVRSFTDFEQRFGSLSSTTYIPQTIREYLKNAGSVTVCRVLAGGGYTFSTSPNVQPVALIVGSGNAVEATAATASFAIVDGTLGVAETELQLGIGGTEYRFVFHAGATAPADEGNLFYVLSGSDNTEHVSNLVSELVAHVQSDTLFQNITASGATILLSASVAGLSGNDITIQTGSGTITSNITPGFGGGLNNSIEGGVLAGLIYPSKIGGQSNPSLEASTLLPASPSVTGSFNVFLNGNNVEGSGETFSSSANPANEDYLFKFIGSNPDNSKTSSTAYAGMPGYTKLEFKKFLESTIAVGNNDNTEYAGIGSGSLMVRALQSSTDANFNYLGNTEGYSYATTPYIHSQIALGRKQLFRFHTINHGEIAKKYKVSISGLKEPNDIDGIEQYSSFTVQIRNYDDTDQSPTAIETYTNVNLNPEDVNYICRRIGDRYTEFNETLDKVEIKGNYPNISNCIRVEVHSSVSEKALSPKLSPKGFAAVTNPFPTASLSVNCIMPSASYEGIMQVGTDGVYNSKGFLGWKFNEKFTDNNNFVNPIPTLEEANVSGHFSVENYSGHNDSSLWSGSLSASLTSTGATGPTATQLKFTVPFQGGGSGLPPWRVKNVGSQISATNLYGFNMNGTSTTGYKAYKKALTILSNQDEYDINMLAMPGVIKSLHSATANAGIDMCEERGDCFFVMDLSTVDASVNAVVGDVAGLDTNYAAVYYPWVRVLDTARNIPVLVPPSVIVPGAIAASDAIAAEWFAPAGLNRGVLGNVMDAKLRLNQAERDILYDNKINPIATFPQSGVCIWGQKTLQERSTALDRINVRRLLIALKKFIASSSRYLVFEQNTQATRNRFLNIVNPYLESVQQRQGLFAFRVVMDESNNTPDVIDRNQLVGAIYLQPTRTAEFIVLDFNVMPTGATFDGGGSGGAGGGGSY